jgi:hypothetical protein
MNDGRNSRIKSKNHESPHIVLTRTRAVLVRSIHQFIYCLPSYSRSNRGDCFFPSSPIARRLVSYPLPASSFREEQLANLSISPTPESDSAWMIAAWCLPPPQSAGYSWFLVAFLLDLSKSLINSSSLWFFSWARIIAFLCLCCLLCSVPHQLLVLLTSAAVCCHISWSFLAILLQDVLWRVEELNESNRGSSRSSGNGGDHTSYHTTSSLAVGFRSTTPPAPLVIKRAGRQHNKISSKLRAQSLQTGCSSRWCAAVTAHPSVNKFINFTVKNNFTNRWDTELD